MDKRSSAEPLDEVKGPDVAELFKKKPWGEAEARAVLKEWEESGVALETFAQERGLVAQRLRWWCNRLGRTTAREETQPLRLTAVRVVERKKPVSGKRAPMAAPERMGMQRGGIELELPTGLRIHLERDFEPEALRRLLDVVEGRAC